MTVRTLIFFLAGLCCSLLSPAQNSNKVQATADKNRILIGEPLQITITVQPAPGTPVNFSSDSIPHFEILGQPLIDTIGENNFKAVYTLTSFDSGHWVIPSFSIAEGLRTDTLPVDVVFSDFNPDQPYHDITDVEDVPVENKKTSWWFFILCGVATLVIFYFIFRKKKAVHVPSPVATRPVNAYEEAMRQLKELEGSTRPAKEFYSSLTDIFRLYVFCSKNILTLQKTTDDLVVQLHSLEMDKQVFHKLSEALRMSDFVKFAKYVPAETDKANSLDAIREAVMHIGQPEQDTTGIKNKNRG